MCAILTMYIMDEFQFVVNYFFIVTHKYLYVSEMENLKSHKKSNAQSYEPLSRYNVCSNTHANIHMN